MRRRTNEKPEFGSRGRSGWSDDPLRVGVLLSRGAVAQGPGPSVKPGAKEPALRPLERLGFRVTACGSVSVSARCTRTVFERIFGTRLRRLAIEPGPAGMTAARSVFYPTAQAPWSPHASIASAIDDAHIQWPHIYFNTPLFPPRVAYHHLRVPGDVAIGVNAARAHRRGVTGRGVRVAVIDSGFALSHPYLAAGGFEARVVLAPGASRAGRDPLGHGTGVCANLLAVAPDVEMVGVKLNDDLGGRGASLLEGFQTALALEPRIISLSVGYDLVGPGTRAPLRALPNSLLALQGEIEAAVASGIVVVAAAGNGHLAFPAMMPSVLAVGGACMGESGGLVVSDYASAFRSRVYAGRRVPDVCGLVGLSRNHASYIMLPVPPASRLDRENAAYDGTGRADGWGVFSGTSSAAPQVAGVCALLLQHDPSLTPAQLRRVLQRSARAVGPGSGSAPSGGGRPRHGLVDAHAALRAL